VTTLRIAVGVKHVPDLDSVDVDPLTGAVDRSRLLWLPNPADEGAVELALRHRDVHGGEVHVATVGPPEVRPTLERVLGAGVDGALRVWDDGWDETRPDRTAAALAAMVRAARPARDLVLLGARTVDRGSGLVPGLLAERLGWPVATDLAALDLDSAAPGVIRAVRRRERGVEEDLEISLPAVLGLLPDLARLREASLPDLLAARRATPPVMAPPPADDDARGPLPAPTETRALPRRPRARALFTPASDAPAFERVTQMLGAGVSRRAGRILEASPDELAEAAVGFLEQRGFLPSPPGAGRP